MIKEIKPWKTVNRVQHYEWGTQDAIPALLGLENPKNEPYAELWMGSHPRGPSYIAELEAGLDTLIRENPAAMLGEKNVERFGPDLPFLFKVLSAAKPLSIQVHPDKEQAEAGFEKEERKGIPRDGFNRTYKDKNHKPEIICALTPFTALCGFRRYDEINELFKFFTPELYRSEIMPNIISGLPGSDDSAPGAPGAAAAGKAAVRELQLAKLFKTVFTLSRESLKRLLDELEKNAIKYIDEMAGSDTASESDPVLILGTPASAGILTSLNAERRVEIRKAASMVCTFRKEHGDDPGVTAPLFLNILELSPGEALFQGAGVLHAYIEGTGIELMANSDNVLRGGLTKKYIDREELFSLLSYAGGDAEVLLPLSGEPAGSRREYTYKDPAAGPGRDAAELLYPDCAQEFLLSRIQVQGGKDFVRTPGWGGEFLLCIEGRIEMVYQDRATSQSSCLGIKKGESVFVPAALDGYRIGGTGTLFCARVPRRPWQEGI